MNRITTLTIASSMLLATLLLPLVISGCSKSDNETEIQYITIKGSDTMVHLVSIWAEEFMNANSDFEISVTGGGSGTGIAALLNGTTDICAASRKIKDKEIKLAGEKGITPSEIVVARDGIAVVVNPSNPVSELTVEKIGKIFTGATTSWDMIGGNPEPIEVLSRESSSGTYVFFQDKVLNRKDYSQKAKLMPATSAIVQSVSSNENAIGYVGLGYAIAAKGKIKMLSVKADDSSPAVKPSAKTVMAGDYVIARPLQFYTNGTPSPAVKKFLDYCKSPQGQKIVSETGYVTVQ